MPTRPLALCFHTVSATWQDALAVTPEELERHLVALLRRGYEPVPAGDFLAGHGKLLHVTFDDALAGVLYAAEALHRLGVPGTVFACSAFSENGHQSLAVPELASAPSSELRTLGWEELGTLPGRGVEVGSHGISHAHLTRLDDVALARELEESKRRIEEELDRPCRFFAYPFGEHDRRVREATRKAGYEAAFGLPGDRSWSDTFLLPRVGVWRGNRPLHIRVKASPLGPAVAGAKARASDLLAAAGRRHG